MAASVAARLLAVRDLRRDGLSADLALVKPLVEDAEPTHRPKKRRS